MVDMSKPLGLVLRITGIRLKLALLLFDQEERMALPDRSSIRLTLRNRATRLRRRLASEQGFAVPTVLLMTVAAMGIASVGIMTSIQGQSGTVRDQGSKTAAAVAESGVEQALLYYNRGAAPCTPAVAGDWCGPVTGTSVNGGAVSYWTRLDSGEGCEVSNEIECVEIVSLGTVNGVTRRVDVMASSLPTEEAGGPGPFASAGVLSQDTMILDSNAIIHTGSATNGDIELNSNAKQCGPASVGVGKELNTSANAGYYTDVLCQTTASTYQQQELTLPPVDQGDAATNNDNGRFFAKDQISGSASNVCWNGFTAAGQSSNNCGAREMRIDSNTTLTLTGSVYSFCKLTMRSNTSIYVASPSATIYFDSPEACGYTSPPTQLDMDSNSRITSASGVSAVVALLFVGSDTIQTNIQLDSNTLANEACIQNFVIYAPRTDVTFDSNTRFCGAVAGKTVHLNSNAEIRSSSSTDSFTLPGVDIPETAAHYTPYRFVECSALVASVPDEGC
jgi:hypothetical protein